MNSRPHRRTKDGLRAALFGLTKACPFHLSNPEDCPLYQLRKMKPARRQKWFNGLNEATLRYLATYHHVCLKIKMEAESRQPAVITKPNAAASPGLSKGAKMEV